MTNNIKKIEAEYIQPCQIVKKYGVSRSTVYRWINMMLIEPRYKNSILFVGSHLRLVREQDLQAFLQSQSNKYFKE